jgi:DNA-binding NarL/FixJ family response regulator
MPALDPIQLVILDERPIVRAGIVACFHGVPDIHVAGAFATLPECVAAMSNAPPDVVIVGNTRRASSNTAIRELKRVRPELRGLVLSPCGGSTRARMAIAAGADGFMQLRASASELADAARTVAVGHRFLDNATAMDMANRSGDDDLSPKEIEVLQRVAAGSANKQIAFEMSTTEGTVKNHMKRILQKLHAVDRTHAVVIAARRGFIGIHQ